jgi:hypothetical protein
MRSSTGTPFILILLVLGARAATAQTTGTLSGTLTLFETALENRPAIEIFDPAANL